MAAEARRRERMRRLANDRFPVPHAAQRVVLESNAQYRVLNAGRRFGKTDLFSIELGSDAMMGYPVSYMSVSYKNVLEMWGRLKSILAPVITYKNETNKLIEVIGGGSIECWSLEQVKTADNARGRKYKKVVVDEAAFVPDLQYVWEQVIMAFLVDYDGDALFGSSANGMNFFKTMWDWGQDPLKTLWGSWHFSIWDNPFLSRTAIEKVQMTVTERAWEEEYLSLFKSDSGSVFRGVEAAAKVEMGSRVPIQGRRYIFGVDWGKDNDYTAIYVIDADSKEFVWVDRFREIGWELQRGRLVNLFNVWKPMVIWAESNSIGSVNIEALQREGLPVQSFQTTAASKAPLIEGLALAIERGDVGLLTEAVGLNELLAYTMKRLAGGGFRYEAPSGGHDDTVIAMALAWWGVTQGGFEVIFA